MKGEKSKGNGDRGAGGGQETAVFRACFKFCIFSKIKPISACWFDPHPYLKLILKLFWNKYEGLSYFKWPWNKDTMLLILPPRVYQTGIRRHRQTHMCQTGARM